MGMFGKQKGSQVSPALEDDRKTNSQHASARATKQWNKLGRKFGTHHQGAAKGAEER